MKTVLFACVRDDARSQIAAAWFNKLADPSKARALSVCAIAANTAPARGVRAAVLEAMKEVGIDLSREQPRFLSHGLSASAAILITTGCTEACLVVPGVRRDDWSLEDPRGKSIARVRRIRDELKARIARLLIDEGWTLDSEVK